MPFTACASTIPRPTHPHVFHSLVLADKPLASETPDNPLRHTHTHQHMRHIHRLRDLQIPRQRAQHIRLLWRQPMLRHRGSPWGKPQIHGSVNSSARRPNPSRIVAHHQPLTSTSWMVTPSTSPGLVKRPGWAKYTLTWAEHTLTWAEYPPRWAGPPTRSAAHPSGPASKFTIRRTNRSLLAGALSAMRRVSAVSAWGFRS